MNKAFYRAFICSVFLSSIVLSGCADLYGMLGGADSTETFKSENYTFKAILDGMSGVWYSHYAGMGRLDGYRIGKWKDFETLMAKKKDLFPNMKKQTYTDPSGINPPGDDDYFVFYDDTVYGQNDDGTGGNGGWGDLVTRYVGIVRAVNVFNGNKNRGAIIIEYLDGCAPGWLDGWPESKSGGRPFFGIYYRVLGADLVQMANAVDLAALYAGKRYYTETATLEDAIKTNNSENEAEFISWGIVIPQDREPQ
ncbi:MAG: hypothetical protein LBD86_01515 [Spirochaetaceae bacterium]|nr:hypothetical protein [Spirochaetaceae bacterium]